MLTCIFGLTACGSKEETVSASTQNNQLIAERFAEGYLIPQYTRFIVDGQADAFLAEYTAKEAAVIMQSLFAPIGESVGVGLQFDGAGVLGSVTSFAAAEENIGAIVEIGEASSVVKGDEIIVTVPVTGEKKTATVEMIVSDDIFFKVKSCSINADLTMGEMMGKAGLNTLLGMGTVFTVLILIMGIIYAFALIPKIQNKFASKKEAGKEATAPVAAPAAAAPTEDLTDDLELVAVIAAAVAASEGAASTDGFVVRSIRRAKRR